MGPPERWHVRRGRPRPCVPQLLPFGGAAGRVRLAEPVLSGGVSSGTPLCLCESTGRDLLRRQLRGGGEGLPLLQLRASARGSDLRGFGPSSYCVRVLASKRSAWRLGAEQTFVGGGFCPLFTDDSREVFSLPLYESTAGGYISLSADRKRGGELFPLSANYSAVGE